VLGNLADGIFAAGGLALLARALALAADAGAIVGTVVVVSAAEGAYSVGAKLALRTALVVGALCTAVTVSGAGLSTIAVLDASAALGAETVLAVGAREGALSVARAPFDRFVAGNKWISKEGIRAATLNTVVDHLALGAQSTSCCSSTRI
jgi:hypothetical protein